MITFTSPRHKTPIYLGSSHLQLLQLIANLGFVNRTQLDMLWSVCVHYPTVFTASILREWCKRGGLLYKMEKPKNTIAKGQLNRPVWLVSKYGKQYLAQQHLWDPTWANEPVTGLSNHNEQAIEVMVQGLYAACFKTELYGYEPQWQTIRPRSAQNGTMLRYKQKCLHPHTTKHLTEGNNYLDPLGTIGFPYVSQNIPFIFNTLREAGGAASSLIDGTGTVALTHQNKSGGAVIGKTKATVPAQSSAGGRAQQQAPEATKLEDMGPVAQGNQVVHMPLNLQRQLRELVGSTATVSITSIQSLIHDLLIDGSLVPVMIDKPTSDVLTSSLLLPLDIPLHELLPTPTTLSITTTLLYRQLQYWTQSISTIKQTPLNVFVRQTWPRKRERPGSPQVASLNQPRHTKKRHGLETTSSNDDLLVMDPRDLDKLLDSSINGSAHHGHQKAPRNGHSRESQWTPVRPLRDQVVPSQQKHHQQVHSSQTQQPQYGKALPHSVEHQYPLSDQIRARPGSTQEPQSVIGAPKMRPLVDTVPSSATHCSSIVWSWGWLPSDQVNIGLVPQLHQQVATKALTYWLPRSITNHLLLAAAPADVQAVLSSQHPLTVEQEALAIQLGLIRSWLIQIHSSQWHTVDPQPEIKINHDRPPRFREPQTEPVDRSRNLINNAGLHPTDFDGSSFNRQFNLKPGVNNDFPFVADQMLSFERHHRPHQIFEELDNRTENNATQIQKMQNYTWYALHHPELAIDVLINTTDGSLTTQRLDHPVNVGRRLGNLASRFMRAYNVEQGQSYYLNDLYSQTHNLHIYLSGVGESAIDLAMLMNGTNFLADWYQSLQDLVMGMNQDLTWRVSFHPNRQMQYVLDHPQLMQPQFAMINQPIINPQERGIYQYLPPEIINSAHIWGSIHFDYEQGNVHYAQPVLFGLEHQLDTVLATYNQIYLGRNNRQANYPIVIYPHREIAVTAITLPDYQDNLPEQETYSYHEPLLVQPHWGMSDNRQLHTELRWVLRQYHKAIQQYFITGWIRKQDQQHHLDYGQRYLPLLHASLADAPRPYGELRQLASTIDSLTFVNQLRLNEVPLGVFRVLLERWPAGRQAISMLEQIASPTTRFISHVTTLPTTTNWTTWLSRLNSTKPSARSHPSF